MKGDLDLAKKRLDDIEFIAHKTQRRTAHFDDINHRLTELDHEIKILESKVSQELTKAMNSQEVLN